jgi:hypothetical protein
MARTRETLAGGATRRDRIGSLRRGSAIDTPLVRSDVGDASNLDTSATTHSGDVTKIPGRGVKGALNWARHWSSDQPDVAVKADDHKWLVAMVVQVLPRLFALGSVAPTRGEMRVS